MANKNKWLILAVVAVLGVVFIITQTAATNPGQGEYKLGGSWIGHRADGFRWSCLQVPLDSSRRTGAIHVAALNWAPGYPDIVAAFGGDAVSDPVGEIAMITRDTGRWTMIAHEQQTKTHQITAIEVYSGTFKYTGPDTAVLSYTLKIYSPAADTNGDGYPDQGDPLITIPDLTDTAERVPILK